MSMMHAKVWTLVGLVGLIAAALTACSDAPPVVGEKTDFAAVCNTANDGHRVAVAGYLRLPDTISLVRTGRGGTGTPVEIVVVRLFQTKTFQGTPIGVGVGFGSEPNHMEEIPSNGFRDEDLKVHAVDGQIAPFGTQVKVSGTVYFPVSGLSNAEFTCGLSNPLVELAT